VGHAEGRRQPCRFQPAARQRREPAGSRRGPETSRASIVTPGNRIGLQAQEHRRRRRDDALKAPDRMAEGDLSTGAILRGRRVSEHICTDGSMPSRHGQALHEDVGRIRVMALVDLISVLRRR